MTVTTPILKPVSQINLEPGSTVSIPNVNWQEFESIMAELGERRAARIAYSQGTLEIMLSFPEHQRQKELISDFVKALLKAKGIRYQPFGSTTFRQEGAAGVEPDACFYIQHCQQMIGRRRLEPNDPPPDLAIQSDLTSKTKLDAYQVIGVPEIWVYDRGKLEIYLLREGKYITSETSPTFPEIPITQIIPAAVERSWQVGHVQALEEFEEVIRDGKNKS
ncbi:MAG: Uma2 family endonuclease [Symploca sp. SIO1A3]|nr:Uma2 family endonuclease [Symploca sp. SIO1A3]